MDIEQYDLLTLAQAARDIDLDRKTLRWFMDNWKNEREDCIQLPYVLVGRTDPTPMIKGADWDEFKANYRPSTRIHSKRKGNRRRRDLVTSETT